MKWLSVTDVLKRLTCGLLFVIATLWLFSPVKLYAQQDSVTAITPTSTVDTLILSGDSTSQSRSKEEYVPFQMKKSGLLAVGLSFFVPGAGQIYDEAYWKAPVIWGLGGYWIYEWVTLNKSYKDYADQYNQSVLLYPTSQGDDRLKSQRDFYHEERDKFAWYLGVLYFLNVVDAYVGANLYDFEVTPDLGPNQTQSMQVRATFHARF